MKAVPIQNAITLTTSALMVVTGVITHRTHVLAEVADLRASLQLPSEKISISGRHLRVWGTAFNEAGTAIHVRLSVNGEPVEAIWGLPNIDAFDGSEASYMSGFTKIVDLGPEPNGRSHEIVVTLSDVAGTEMLRRTVTVIRDPAATRPENWAAGMVPDFRAFGDAFLDLLVSSGLQPDHKAVEIGPGAGRCSVAVARYLCGGTLHAFDVDDSAVRFCRKNITSRYPHAMFSHQDVENGVYNPSGSRKADDGVLDLEASSCDFAFCWSVFTHLVEEDFATYLREFARILRPGGKTVFSAFIYTPQRMGTDLSPMGGGFWTSNPGKPEAAIEVESDILHAMLRDAGFSNVSVHKVDFDRGFRGGQRVIVATRS